MSDMTSEPDRSPTTPARVGVIVASTGRPEELQQLLSALDRQSFRPSRILLSLHSAADAPASVAPDVEVVYGPKGASAQRNRGLDELENKVDFIAFLDDDYLPASRMLSGALAVFEAWPDVVGCNGRLLADGIHSRGVPYEEAIALLERHERQGREEVNICDELDGMYGCNMVFRSAAIQGTRFDENLPLYSWQEDVDFAARLKSRGRLIRTDAFAGVHRGVKRARGSGVRFGYSQVVNPIYLARKRTMGWPYARKLIRNNFAANLARAFFPEPWVDRRGRLVGNMLGFFDVMLRRDDPRRILQLS